MRYVSIRLPLGLSLVLAPAISPAVAERAQHAQLRSLDANLRTHDSATAVLERWCAQLRLADPPTVIADRVVDGDKPATSAVRRLLHIERTTPVAYRRVRLRCGSAVLSEADNWYVPARVTPDMNHALQTSDVPFGRVVRPLNFRRRTLSSTRLHLPRFLQPTTPVLRYRAVLDLPDGTPISLVVETYRAVLTGARRPAKS